MYKIKKPGFMSQYARKIKRNTQSGRPGGLSEKIPESKGVNNNTDTEKEKLAMRLKFYKTDSLALPL
jgi:hypothetical protein